MLRRFSVNFAVLSIILDGGIISLSLLAAVHLRPFLSYLPFAADIGAPTELPRLLYVTFPTIWVAILLLFSVYDGRRNFRVVDEFTSVTLASLLATISLAGTLYFSFRDISRVLFLTFFLIAYFLLLFWRSAARVGFRFMKGNNAAQHRLLIVGAGPVGRDLEKKINQYSALGLNVVGFLDDDPAKRARQFDVLGALADAKRVVSNHQIDEVVIALPPRAHDQLACLVADLHSMPVRVWVIPDYFQLALHKAAVDEVAGIPMLDLRAPALNDYQRMVKRAFDLIITLCAMIPALPLMGIISLAIRLEGKGTILFKQQRVGENGHLFSMIKFRTMVPNAEQLRHLVEKYDENGKLIHKSVNDPRVTKVGHFLRRTSLDELPQLFNVLKGDMSLIGPRPELPYLVEKYEPWQRKRFAVPQGITGWWQVNGRSDKPMHLHTEDDLYYVRNYSLQLDLVILIRTVWVVLRGKGAY